MAGSDKNNKLDIFNIKKAVNESITQSESKHVEKERVIPYIFVSFDLTDSTKLKHETESWEKVISELFNSMPLVRSFLNFWKFNGDELLFYKEIKSLYQIVAIIEGVYSAMHEMSNNLSMQKTQDDTGKSWYKVDLKSTIWIAGIDFKNNFRINPPYGYDFIGSEIDEGFRLTKLATKGKCVIDPKIALMLAGFNAALNDSISTAELHKYFEIFAGDIKESESQKGKIKDESELESKPNNKKSITKRNEIQTYYNLPHALFARNFIVFYNRIFENIRAGEEKDTKTFNSIKNCVDRMKLVGYACCKGVWDEKEYPIIWYSKNWTRLDKEVAYNERIGNDEINKDRINKYYKDVDEDGYGIVTYLLLENIYRNIPSFSNSLNRIFQLSQLKLSTEPTMFRYSAQYTGIYYIVVCYLKDTDSVLMLLRSQDRGHLANVWDFCSQKHLSGMDEEDKDQVFKNCIKKRYGINIILEEGYTKSTIKPFSLKPIYRNGNFNQGIVCYAEIDTSAYLNKQNIEKQLIDDIKNALQEDLSTDKYPYFTDVKFVKRDSFDDFVLKLDNHFALQLDYNAELNDSRNKYKNLKEDCPVYVSDTKEILSNVFDYYKNKYHIGEK